MTGLFIPEGACQEAFSAAICLERKRGPWGSFTGAREKLRRHVETVLSLSHMYSRFGLEKSYFFFFFFVTFKLILVVIWLACHESTYEKNRFIFSRNMNWVFFVGFSCYVQFDWLETFCLFFVVFFVFADTVIHPCWQSSQLSLAVHPLWTST